MRLRIILLVVVASSLVLLSLLVPLQVAGVEHALGHRSVARNAPDCQSIASTRVVLPWSACATIATLRRSSRAGSGRAGIRKPYRISSGWCSAGPPGNFSQRRQRLLERLFTAS